MHLNRVFKAKLAFTPICLGLSLFASSSFAEGNVGKYDFNYAVSNSERIHVVQVFDDGMQTFFQFRDGEILPVIFKLTTAGPVSADAKIAGQYLAVPGVAGEYILKVGRSVSRVVYAGGGRFTAQSAKDALATGQINPADRVGFARSVGAATDGPPTVNKTNPVSEVTNTYATPVQGDVVRWGASGGVSKQLEIFFTLSSTKLIDAEKKQIRNLASQAGADSQIDVTIYADDDHKHGVIEGRAKAVVDVLLSAGYPRDRIHLKTSESVIPAENGLFKSAVLVARFNAIQQAKAAATNQRGKRGQLLPIADAPVSMQASVGGNFGLKETQSEWVMRMSDGTIQATLSRWASQSGWRVVIRGVPPIPLLGDATFRRSGFLQAADYVISQVKASGYHIRASAYSDNVLLVTAD